MGLRQERVDYLKQLAVQDKMSADAFMDRYRAKGKGFELNMAMQKYASALKWLELALEIRALIWRFGDLD